MSFSRSRYCRQFSRVRGSLQAHHRRTLLQAQLPSLPIPTSYKYDVKATSKNIIPRIWFDGSCTTGVLHHTYGCDDRRVEVYTTHRKRVAS